MCFSSPKVPEATPPPAIAKDQEAAVTAAQDNERRRRAMAAGRASTILTGPQGVMGSPSAGPKTLLGG